jgi:hypothetical protein
MARPGLEPGTPRFSGLSAEVSNTTKPLRRRSFRMRRTHRRDIRCLRTFRPLSGTRRGASPQCESDALPLGKARAACQGARPRRCSSSAALRRATPLLLPEGGAVTRTCRFLVRGCVSCDERHARFAWKGAASPSLPRFTDARAAGPLAEGLRRLQLVPLRASRSWLSARWLAWGWSTLGGRAAARPPRRAVPVWSGCGAGFGSLLQTREAPVEDLLRAAARTGEAARLAGPIPRRPPR